MNVNNLIEILARQYATQVINVVRLGDGEKQVYRVGRAEGSDWIVRTYQPDGYQGDFETVASLAELLLFLERHAYPAERVIKAVDSATVTRLGEQPVLVTTFVGQTLRPWQAGTAQSVARTPLAEDIVAAETFSAVGAALARLHTLPLHADTPLRRAGMLPRRELSWVAGQLAELAGRVPSHWQAEYENLVAAVQTLDYCEDLPSTLIHNDPNLGNVIMTPAGEIVLIDWECAGLGPAVLDVGILLRNCYSKPKHCVHEAAVLAVVDGYCQHRRLTPTELERLPTAIRFMTLVLLAACFPDRVDGTLNECDLLYGATYGEWQAEYAAADAIAALAQERFVWLASING